MTRYKEDTHDKAAKEWYLLFQKNGEWIKYIQKKVSWWNAEMIMDYQLKCTKVKFKIVHYSELDKKEDENGD